MSVCSLHVRSFALAFLVLGSISACADDEGSDKLFQERGVWSLSQYDLQGDGVIDTVNASARRDAFLLNFDDGVVTAAWCGDNENVTPVDSLCRQQSADARWYCSCYAYAYEGSRMRWVEFDAGAARPQVRLDGAPPSTPMGETEGDDEEEPAPSDGGSTDIIVSAAPTQSHTYDFVPLPTGLFGSNGENSKFRFQQKAAVVFDEVTCTPCAGE